MDSMSRCIDLYTQPESLMPTESNLCTKPRPKRLHAGLGGPLENTLRKPLVVLQRSGLSLELRAADVIPDDYLVRWLP